MFKWYRASTKCYVYLSDISSETLSVNEDGSFNPSLSDFGKSRWFTRGWTLQELIAPTRVEFFSVDGKFLGDRVSLEHQIFQTTGVPVDALRGSPLWHFHVDERLSWAAKRKTSREEDAAYSLLGIFSVHMPLIYGEGYNEAMDRLHEGIEKSLEKGAPCLDTLRNGQELKHNQSLISGDRRYSLNFQGDGDLILTGPAGVLWASNTADVLDTHNVVMQRDGNLVMYTDKHKAVWATHTAGRRKAKCILQSDGNFVIYSDHLPVWATHTTEGKEPHGLNYGQRLIKGQSLVSKNRRYRMTFQNDGNLVYRGPQDVILWASNTSGWSDARDLYMQKDGNLVMYSDGGKAIWASKTVGNHRAELRVKDDGTAVIQSEDGPIRIIASTP